MPHSPAFAQRPRRVWLMPAIIAIVAVIIAVTGNLVANDLDPILEPYRKIVWVIFGIAALVAIAAAIWEARRTSESPPSSEPTPVSQTRNVSVSGDVKGNTIITGDQNVVKPGK